MEINDIEKDEIFIVNLIVDVFFIFIQTAANCLWLLILIDNVWYSWLIQS